MYMMGKTTVTIAFSNPFSQKQTWRWNKWRRSVGLRDDGGSRLQKFVEDLTVDDKELYFVCKCTGSDTNVAEVTIYIK